ncbi:MAG: hypothetical protein JJU29_17785 [Verrucomicrobia bacterium]|nr:hypothetical protein [Verrucomicrobiota bacterium]
MSALRFPCQPCAALPARREAATLQSLRREAATLQSLQPLRREAATLQSLHK